MEALLKVRLTLVVFMFAHLSVLATSSSKELMIINAERTVTSSSQELQIINAQRRIEFASHIVNVYLTLKVENLGTSPASEVHLAFSPAQVEHLVLIKAASTTRKMKEKTYVPLEVKSTELPDAPNGTKYFSMILLTPLNKGETATLEVLYDLTHALGPFPSEISQSESELVFRDSAILLSAYHVKQQTTFIKTPGTWLASFSVVEPTEFTGTELKYGPYDNQAPYSYSPILVHFVNNNPFAVVEKLKRIIEISRGGSLQVTEQYRIAGSRHKGVFSRFGYQTRPGSIGVSSVEHLLARLPPRVHSVYYHVEIRNISSSNLRTDFLKSELEIEPQYPLFGGWTATFVIGYGLPSQDFLFESPDGRKYLNFTFGCPLPDTVVDKLIIKVVLPKGSKDPLVVVPFPVEQRLETIFGRTVVVLQKGLAVPEHNTPFQVYYSFNSTSMDPVQYMLAAMLWILVAKVALPHPPHIDFGGCNYF